MLSSLSVHCHSKQNAYVSATFEQHYIKLFITRLFSMVWDAPWAFLTSGGELFFNNVAVKESGFFSHLSYHSANSPGTY